jgi:putative pantetheine hydrolase
MKAGPANSLGDVPGLTVGHITLNSDGWLTGTTVVLAPAEGAVAGVDARGGAPGTRETDLLDPRNAVERVNAIVLSGGSAYGLATADGVMRRLGPLGRGVRVGPGPAEVVPIVPAAILFDLGRGGVFDHYPDAACGAAAFDAALASPAGALDSPGPAAAAAEQGCVGAGTGATAGALKGGIGSASAVLSDGSVVAALAAVNAVGSAVSARDGTLYGAAYGLPGEFDWLRSPSAEDLAAADDLALDRSPRPAPGPGHESLNTTLGVVATNVPLTKAQCARMAGSGQDGLARAIRPAHTMFDGDTIFGLSVYPPERNAATTPWLFHEVLAAAADCMSRAIVHGVLSAVSVRTPAGSWPAYLDAFPSASSSAPAGS